MNIFFHLSTCNTCQRIAKELALPTSVTQQDIKTEAISAEQLDTMQALAGSYEALFSRRARKFRAQGLHEQELAEVDYRRLILEEYTFLKRPVLVLEDEIFVGNSKKVVDAAAKALSA